jgi:hypothetical protein
MTCKSENTQLHTTQLLAGRGLQFNLVLLIYISYWQHFFCSVLCNIKENSQIDNNTELYTHLQSGFPCRS